VDDCNSLLHRDNVKSFLDRFVQRASPLGAILQAEKTCILIATNSTKLTEQLLASNDPSDVASGTSLEKAILLYSRKLVGDKFEPVEVVEPPSTQMPNWLSIFL
jgi:hypothetical protein